MGPHALRPQLAKARLGPQQEKPVEAKKKKCADQEGRDQECRREIPCVGWVGIGNEATDSHFQHRDLLGRQLRQGTFEVAL